MSGSAATSTLYIYVSLFVNVKVEKHTMQALFNRPIDLISFPSGSNRSQARIKEMALCYRDTPKYIPFSTHNYLLLE